MDITCTQLAQQVELICVRTDKFKTGVFSVTLAVPLKKENATANALIGDVLYRGSRKHPDIESISLATDELYGASLGPSIRQRGESQCIGFSASFLDDRYALDGTAVLEPVLELMGELLLDPITENGVFRADFVRSEGANLADQIRARVNDKRSWSIFRLTQEMCAGEPYALDKLGCAEEAEKMAAERLWERYRALLREARVIFYYGGAASAQRVEAAVRSTFRPLITDRTVELSCSVLPEPKGEVRRVTDEMDVTQGKLALGFRTGGITAEHPDFPALLVCNALYGGTPNSKLFTNVRERLSLCYYASSIMDKLKGIMVVSSGVEFEKFTVAEDKILAQLNAVRRGDMSESELVAAKRAVIASFQTCMDSQGRLEDHWTTQAISGGTMESPDRFIGAVERVTAEDVMRAAGQIRLDTVYRLTGKEEE